MIFRIQKAEIGPQPDGPPTIKKVVAPTSGTKWHNEPGVKKWYEAKSDEGYTYYWNTETHGKIHALLYGKFGIVLPFRAKYSSRVSTM